MALLYDFYVIFKETLYGLVLQLLRIAKVYFKPNSDIKTCANKIIHFLFCSNRVFCTDTMGVEI